MKRRLLLVGGVVNVLFLLFHLWLGWNFHHASQLPLGVRGLLEMLNIGGSLCIAFLAYASLVHRDDMVGTGLGRSTSILAVLVYGTRGLGEFIFTPGARPPIILTCAAVTTLYVIIVCLPGASRRDRQHP